MHYYNTVTFTPSAKKSEKFTKIDIEKVITDRRIIKYSIREKMEHCILKKNCYSQFHNKNLDHHCTNCVVCSIKVSILSIALI